MISLSTAWTPEKLRRRPAKIFAAGKKMGFNAFELGISPARFDLRAVTSAIERRGIEISSVHAVCSQRQVPPPTCRGDWVAEPDETLRRQGVDLVKETLDIARRVGAPAVVLHGGTLPMADAADLQARLFYLESLGSEAPQRPPDLAKFTRQRAEIAEPYLAALEASLRELCEYAPDITLALENRYHISDLPHGDEFQRIFDRVAAPNLRYWHDGGHACVLDRIGFLDHLGLLDKYAPRLAGMHLHDILGFEDHRPPGTGDFNFGAIADYLRPDVIRVIEVSSVHSAKAVERGRKHLAEAYGIK